MAIFIDTFLRSKKGFSMVIDFSSYTPKAYRQLKELVYEGMENETGLIKVQEDAEAVFEFMKLWVS